MNNVFYDCNIPDEKEGYRLIEVSEDIWEYKAILDEKYEYTSCEDCIHKTDVYALECGECRHFYPCLFEKKDK